MSHFRHVHAFVLFLVLAAVLADTPAVYGSYDLSYNPDAPIYQDKALILDAQQYASDYGVDLEEALRRLELQVAVKGLSHELAEAAPEAFAGLWFQHVPAFHLIVQFTANGEEMIQPFIQGRSFADVVEVRTVAVSLVQLKNTQEAAWSAVRDLGVAFDYDINVPLNRVEVQVTNRKRLEEILARGRVVLPNHVEIVQVAGLSRQTADIYGGLALSPVCTTGFSVKNSSGTKGILTAGHCPNTLYYDSVYLPFQNEADAGPYDFQWHTTGTLTPRNLVYDGTYNRYIYSETPRGYQDIGEYVCKYGKITLGGCGTIISTNYNGTYVRVHSDTVDLGEPGDSGGPWFQDNSAYGIMTGDVEPGNDAYYMAIDYINYFNLDVLTN